MNDALAKLRFSIVTWGLGILLGLQARRHAGFRDQLRRLDLTAQFKLADGSQGRCFIFRDGRVSSKRGIQPSADVTMSFRDAHVAGRILKPTRDRLEFLNAAKNSQLQLEGEGRFVTHFSNALSGIFSAGWKYGEELPDGVVRYTSNTNGGPVFVYVKDGKILRITPMTFGAGDADSWTVEARGRSFTPPKKTTVSPHTLAWKSLVYSPDRLLYPLKRVDFDPQGGPGSTGPGGRNTQNRGISGYERIGWDEALDIVTGEIKRVKRDCGPGAIMSSSGSAPHLGGHRRDWARPRA